jgi:hypothetical protein
MIETTNLNVQQSTSYNQVAESNESRPTLPRALVATAEAVAIIFLAIPFVVYHSVKWAWNKYQTSNSLPDKKALELCQKAFEEYQKIENIVNPDQYERREKADKIAESLARNAKREFSNSFQHIRSKVMSFAERLKAEDRASLEAELRAMKAKIANK